MELVLLVFIIVYSFGSLLGTSLYEQKEKLSMPRKITGICLLMILLNLTIEMFYGLSTLIPPVEVAMFFIIYMMAVLVSELTFIHAIKKNNPFDKILFIKVKITINQEKEQFISMDKALWIKYSENK